MIHTTGGLKDEAAIVQQQQLQRQHKPQLATTRRGGYEPNTALIDTDTITATSQHLSQQPTHRSNTLHPFTHHILTPSSFVPTSTSSSLYPSPLVFTPWFSLPFTYLPFPPRLCRGLTTRRAFASRGRLRSAAASTTGRPACCHSAVRACNMGQSHLVPHMTHDA